MLWQRLGYRGHAHLGGNAKLSILEFSVGCSYEPSYKTFTWYFWWLGGLRAHPIHILLAVFWGRFGCQVFASPGLVHSLIHAQVFWNFLNRNRAFSDIDKRECPFKSCLDLKIWPCFWTLWQVPVGRASASSPVQREIHREIMVAFNTSWSFSASKVNAKSMVRTCTFFFIFMLSQLVILYVFGLTLLMIIVFRFKTFVSDPHLNKSTASERGTNFWMTAIWIGLFNQAKWCCIAWTRSLSRSSWTVSFYTLSDWMNLVVGCCTCYSIFGWVDVSLQRDMMTDKERLLLQILSSI